MAQVETDERLARLRPNLEHLMELNGWSQRRTAGRADIQVQTLRNLLGESPNPTLRVLLGLADALGVALEDLFSDPEELRDRYRSVDALRPFVLRGERATSSNVREATGA